MTNDDQLDATITELSRMSAVEYDQARREIAKQVNLRVTTLDSLVDNARLLGTASTAETINDCWPDTVPHTRFFAPSEQGQEKRFKQMLDYRAELDAQADRQSE